MLDLIRNYPNAVSAALCEELIAKFDADPRRSAGLVGTTVAISRADETIKQSTELDITRLSTDDESWRPFLQGLTEGYLAAIRQYATEVPSTRFLSGKMGATGFNIMCYPRESGHYAEHIDADTLNASYRVLSGVIYLNTVEKGGETHFPYQDRLIEPVQGSISVFPSNYAFPHASLPPASGPKYVCATWFGFVPPGASIHSRYTG
jgi:hypothetical protein